MVFQAAVLVLLCLSIMGMATDQSDLKREPNSTATKTSDLKAEPKSNPATNASTQPIWCSKLPPGVNKMRHGYDLASLDVLPLGVGGGDGTKRSLMEYTCDQGRKWHNSYNGEEYDLPDQVSSISTVPRGILTYDLHLWKSFLDVKRTWSQKVGVEGGLQGGMFGYSSSSQRMQRSIDAEDNCIEDVSSFCSGSRAELEPVWMLELNRGAKAFVDRFLPANYSDNPDAYKTFIENYGTHFYEIAQFGGILKMTMETKKDYVSREGDQKTERNAEASYKNWLGAMGASGEGTNTVDQSFVQNTRETKRYYGGTGDLSGDSFFAGWVPTIASNPWLFAGQLQPISQLIPDQHKSASMEIAIRDHLDRAWLDELAAIVNSLSAKAESYPQTTGDWNICDRLAGENYCEKHEETYRYLFTCGDDRCRYYRIGRRRVGCTVVGCEYKTRWQTHRNGFRSKIQAFRASIDTLRTSRRPGEIQSLANNIQDTGNKIGSGARLVEKKVERNGRKCWGNWDTCPAHVFATAKAPEAYFTPTW